MTLINILTDLKGHGYRDGYTSCHQQLKYKIVLDYVLEQKG